MALRGHPSIPAGTRDRIVAAAGRIGYQRDAVFSALSNRRSRGASRGFAPRIAYLSNRSPENGFYRRTHYRMLVDGARKQAEDLGYRFDVMFVDEGHHNSASIYAHLKEEGISGIIIGAFEPGRAGLDINWSEFCVVKIDSRHMDPPVTFVSTDQLNGVRLSVQKMRALGYSRIGLAVGTDDEEGTDYMHSSGFLMEQAEAWGSSWIPPLLFPSAAHPRDVTPMIGEWIRQHGINAVICNWTNIKTMVTGSGFRCPEDVACACVCLPRKHPTLAGVVANMDLVGQRVASLLATLMRTERRGIPALATTTYVQGTWHDGPSAPLHQ